MLFFAFPKTTFKENIYLRPAETDYLPCAARRCTATGSDNMQGCRCKTGTAVIEEGNGRRKKTTATGILDNV